MEFHLKEIRTYIGDIDKFFALLGIFFSIGLILYAVLHSKNFLIFLTATLTLISCISWIKIRNNLGLIHLFIDGEKIDSTLLHIVFFITYISSIVTFLLRPNLYERPLIFFVLVSFLIGFISIIVLLSKENQIPLILFEIILLGLSTTWSQLVLFPTIIGVDPFYHQMFSEIIKLYGFIPDNYYYSQLPIFHLLAVSTAFLTHLDYKSAVLFSISLSQILLLILFIYLLGKLCFNNYKIGLLSSLMIIIANHIINMNVMNIPNSLAAVSIPIMIYLIYKNSIHDDKRFQGILVVFMIWLVFTHTITSFYFALLLITVYLTKILYRNFYPIQTKIESQTDTRPEKLDDKPRVDVKISLNFVIFFIMFMIFWWTFASKLLFDILDIVKWGLTLDYFIKEAPLVMNYSLTIPLVEQAFNFGGMFLFFSLSLIGIFYMISKFGNESTFLFAMFGLIPLVIGFIPYIIGHSVIEQRWWFFAQIFLSVPLSIGLLLFSRFIAQKTRFTIFFFFLIITGLAFMMIMNPYANVDNNSFSPNYGFRFAYTESELIAGQTLNATAQKIAVDYDFMTLFNYQFDRRDNLNSIDEQLYNKKFIPDGNVTVYRTLIDESAIRVYGSVYKIQYNAKEMIESSGYDKIYDNAIVSAYY